eukprot:g11822.t2
MGVPAFYRWLSEKYPKIVVDMLEDRPVCVEGTEIPLDLTAANPNGIEFDNLYIDMNGIIHPCSHPEDKPPPASEEEMYKNIMDYVDRLFSAVRPRRLLYLAIDGVAPRAKMNQQRSRRFRSAQEAEEAAELMEETRQAMKEMGMKVPPKAKPAWDSNIITPGTEFMHKLSRYLRFYVQDRVNRDKAWQNIKVILSDASEPGEGEHKIMDFVRRQRNQPGYDPNQHHILHGLDADLIMLGLATHERSFTILREQVLFGRQQKEASERKAAAMNAARDALAGVGHKAKRGEHGEHDGDVSPNKPLQMLQLWTLREYLENEFSELEAPGRVPFGYDFERVVDDFVFLCFFVGNDFLPHLPSLGIRDGALDYLFNVYKRVISSLGDYLTANGGRVNLKQVDVIMSEVGEIEDEVFRRRKQADMKDQAWRNRSGGRGGRGGRGGGARGGDERGAGLGSANGAAYGGGQRGLNMSRAEKRKAAIKAKETAKASDDSIKNQAVPIGSVKTDRLKDAKRRLEDGGERGGAAWGGGDGAKTAEGVVGAAAEDANKSAAAKLREKLGGKAGAKKTRKRGGKKNKGANGGGAGGGTAATAAAAAGREGEGEIEDGEGDGEAQPPPTKLPRVEVDAEAKVEGEEQDGEEEEERGGDQDGAKEGNVQEEEEEEDEDEDEDEEEFLDMTEEELRQAKIALKDRVKDQSQALLDDARNSVDDKVRLWEDGWKDRYYADKCKLDDIEGGGGRERLFQTYVEGLCWVMLYYYQGCPSWTWYFPFHYAPFASDLINCDRFVMKFDESKPFRPMEQLMGVLPAASCKALPEPCRDLMTKPDSPIIDFYPKEVQCDPNGQPMPWLWVVLLPFIDEKRLLSNLQPLYSKFTEEEVRRNSFGPSYLFANVRTSLGKALSAFLKEGAAGTTGVKGLDPEGDGLEEGETRLCSEEWGGFGGKLAIPSSEISTPIGATLQAPEEPRGVFEDVPNNQVAMTVYAMPPKGEHLCRMLPGVETLPRTLQPQDLVRRAPPRLNRNMSIAEMGSSKYDRRQQQQGGRYQGGYGAGQRMIRHQLGGSGGGNQGGQSHGHGYQVGGFQGGYQNQGGYEDRHHMHQQTGNRRWGSQEPTPKRNSGRGGRNGGNPGRNNQGRQKQGRHQQQQYGQHTAPPQAYYGQGAPQMAAVPQQPVFYGQQATPVYYQQQPAPVTVAPTAYYATAPQQAPTVAPHTFQHPAYVQAPQQQQQQPQPQQQQHQHQPPPGAAGFPTMDSLRSKLANALLQTKTPATAAPQGVYYPYPAQGAPAQQQPYAVAGAHPVAAAAAAAPPGAAAPSTFYPGQHIRFDDKGNPTWGGTPWTGAPPR